MTNHDDIATISSLESIQTILHLLCEVTGLRVAMVTRVTPDQWQACAVVDNAGMGLTPGQNLELANTY